jgi:nucleotide-binding universal stress UspA family protein
MTQYNSVLVPVDIAEPDTARPAIARAVDLAHASHGTIRLIYVRSILPVTYMEFVPPDFDAEQQREAEQKLAEIAAGIPLPTERVSAVVTMGSVYNDVLQEAEKSAADLIVVGSHRPSMATYLIGSNAARIVRHAKCSVLVVRSAPRAPGGQS